MFEKSQYYIVTGAASGIGKGCALLLNKLGASVIAIDKNGIGLQKLSEEVICSESLFCYEKDLVSELESLPYFVKELKEKYGKLSGCVSCAGIAKLVPLKCLELSEIKELFDINFNVHLMLLKGFADKRNNIGKGASFVAISSAVKKILPRGKSAFSASMSALSTALRCIAKEVAPYGIRVNLLSPTDIDTPLTQSLPDEVRPDYPLGMGQADDVANFVAFLLSDKSKWVTGQDYIVDCASF